MFVLTKHVYASDLLLHHLRVDLTHVATSVRLLNLANLQHPDSAIKTRGKKRRRGFSWF